jgi:TatD DNase family protein
MLVDTHCHLDKLITRGEAEAALERMQDAGVGRCITVGTGPDDWERYLHFCARHPGRVDWTVGMHPCDVGEGWEDHLQTISTYFATEPVPVALGEIGLDHFHLPKFPDEAAEVRVRQEAAFRAQLELAFQLDCPIVVHSRLALEPCIRLIDESGVNWSKVVFHCFTEGPEALEPILERGGRASFTGILTYKNAHPVREAAKLQGLERLMLETDAPYLTPEPLRGKPNEPAHVAHLGRFTADLFGISLEELSERTTATACAFFNLPE